jgi:hypothetical protein
MHTTPVIVIGATMFVITAAVAHADDYSTGTKAAPRVAEMLQKRQENLLREQLLKDGRLDEVRKLDEERVRRQREQREQVVSRMNDELARNTRSDAPANSAVIDPCDKESLRMDRLTAAQREKNLARVNAY